MPDWLHTFAACPQIPPFLRLLLLRFKMLLSQRLINHQPASPAKLAAGLANLHKNSVSPTGKFGFSMSTCHARVAQAVDTWEESWCTLYTKHLGHFMSLAKPILQWPEFNIVCDLTLEKVVPRLLLPLQSDGRTLKPCLVHGDCWDGKFPFLQLWIHY